MQMLHALWQYCCCCCRCSTREMLWQATISLVPQTQRSLWRGLTSIPSLYRDSCATGAGKNLIGAEGRRGQEGELSKRDMKGMFVLIVPAHAQPPAEHRHQRHNYRNRQTCVNGELSSNASVTDP